jgi:hypothetical protein
VAIPKDVVRQPKASPDLQYEAAPDQDDTSAEQKPSVKKESTEETVAGKSIA